MTIEMVDKNDAELVQICKVYGYAPSACASILRYAPSNV
jgi:hypothetical protein